MEPYRQTTSGGWMLAVLCAATAAMVAGAVVSFMTAQPAWAAWLLVGMSVFFVMLILAFRSLTFSVDKDGARASWGGLVGQRIALAEIKSVSVERYKALSFGGWGWRGNRKGDRAFSIIGVPNALVIEQQDGKKLWVTMKDPDKAAQAVNDWLGA